MSQIEISTCYNISGSNDEQVKLSIYISVHNMDNNTIRLKVQWPSAKREKYITELSNMKERQNTRCTR